MSEAVAILSISAGILLALLVYAGIAFTCSRSTGDQPPPHRWIPFETILDEFNGGYTEKPKKISPRKFRPSIRSKVRAKRCGLR